jgi:excisionase family DNA binding protein
VSRPRAALAETRAVARAVQALRGQIERLTVVVEQLHAATPSQLGRVEDACRVLNVSPATLHRRIRDGSIKAIRHGRALRFDLASLATASGARQ